jgi:hypothetical protein
MENENQNNHSSLGFLGGIIVGGAIVLMMGTKKGRKLIDQILTEGEESWGKFLEENPEVEKKLEEKTSLATRFFHKKGKSLS